jgi:hypothetical protein
MSTSTLRLRASAAAARLGVSIKARRLYERLGFRLVAETESSATLIWRA